MRRSRLRPTAPRPVLQLLQLEDRVNPVSFANPVSYEGGGGDVVTADFNGDGKLDAVVTSLNGVAVYLGAGNGTFSTSTILGFGVSSFIARLRLADMNGDGALDIVAGTDRDAAIVILKGNGN